MAVLSANKIVIGAISLGVAGSTGVGGYFYLTRDTRSTIGDLLKSENPSKKKLTNEHVGKVNNSWTNYKTVTNESTANPWNLNNWATISVKEEMPQELLDTCNIKINEKVKDKQQKEYTNFVNWCTVTN